MMTMSERELKIRRNREEMATDPNRTLCPGDVATRNAVWVVGGDGGTGKKARLGEFSVLGDSHTPHTALALHAENGREGRVALMWDEK
jgi:hypothetical protein